LATRVRHTFSLLHVDYVKLDSRWNFRNVISPYCRVYYIDEGEGLVTSGREKVKLEAGRLYIIPSFTLCNLFCEQSLGQYFIHFFEDSPESISLFENNRKIIHTAASDTDVANIKRMLAINPGRGINRSNNPKVYEQHAYYQLYQELNNTMSMATYLETQGILLQLIARFLDSRQFKATSTTPLPSKIMSTISYIRLHLKENLTINELAQRVNLHPDYFSRLFFQYTGIRPLAYIHEKRIERAQYLITTTDLPYSRIAEETGFETLPHFSKVFKKITRVTPGEYKRQQEMYNSMPAIMV